MRSAAIRYSRKNLPLRTITKFTKNAPLRIIGNLSFDWSCATHKVLNLILFFSNSSSTFDRNFVHRYSSLQTETKCQECGLRWRNFNGNISVYFIESRHTGRWPNLDRIRKFPWCGNHAFLYIRKFQWCSQSREWCVNWKYVLCNTFKCDFRFKSGCISNAIVRGSRFNDVERSSKGG